MSSMEREKQQEGQQGAAHGLTPFIVVAPHAASSGNGEMGDDFQLAPNPHAAVPLPESFQLRGIYYGTRIEGTEYRVTPTTN